MNDSVFSSDATEEEVVADTFHLGLFIDSLDPGGAEEVVINLARGMRNRGLRVTLYHFGNPWLSEKAGQHGIKQSILNNWHLYKSKATLPVFVWQFKATLKKDRIDVLHSHLLGAVFAGSIAARLASVGSIGTLHDIYSLDESRNAVAMIRTASRLGSMLVAVAEGMRTLVCDKAGLSIRRVTVIRNGVDLHAHTPRECTNLGEIIKIICVARLVPVKRIDVLLRAVARLQRGARWRLEIIGNGPLERELRELAADLGVGDRVDFAGFVTDVAERLSNADIFVQTSDSEGLSVSIAESMAAGLPSIVTDVGGNSELVLDQESGVLVPAGDVDQIARSIGELIIDESRRTAMGRRARELASRKYSMDSMLQAHLIAYKNSIRG